MRCGFLLLLPKVIPLASTPPQLPLIQNRHRFAFEVVDTGPGIAPERQTAIFEPFEQAKEVVQGGSGLGLAIARRHVEMMGGQLELQSKLGEGSFFFFSLRLPQSFQGQTRPAKIALPRVESLAEGHSVYALIVDDVTTNRDVMRQMLERVGVEVEGAEDGFKALESVDRRMPDIVLMDIRMPGIDGQETMRRIVKEHGPNATKIVAVSASVFEHQQREYEEAGFDGFIDKPVRAEALYGTLAETLGVEFRHSVPQGSSTETARDEIADWSGIRLPGELARELESAARRQSITDLHRHFTTLATLGELEKRLADHLRELSRKFDMNAVRMAIDRVAAN